jgi:hypothetical protein
VLTHVRGMLGLGVVLAVAWVLAALLIGVSPRQWGVGIAMSMIIGMTAGGLLSVTITRIRAH